MVACRHPAVNNRSTCAVLAMPDRMVIRASGPNYIARATDSCFILSAVLIHRCLNRLWSTGRVAQRARPGLATVDAAPVCDHVDQPEVQPVRIDTVPDGVDLHDGVQSAVVRLPDPAIIVRAVDRIPVCQVHQGKNIYPERLAFVCRIVRSSGIGTDCVAAR